MVSKISSDQRTIQNNETPKPIVCRRIVDIVLRFLYSSTLKTFVLGATIAGSITIIVLSNVLAVTIIAAVITGTALLALGMHLAANKKKIAYEVSLFAALLIKTFKPRVRPWWHAVAPHINLGAIPLKNFSHDKKIANDLGVKAVLSLIEDFEFYTKGILSVPCVSQDWHQLNVKHLILHTADFKPVPLEIMEKGVAFLEEQIDNGMDCYVHCKAGRSRSATLVLAYLLKRKMVTSIDDGILYLKQKRPFISISKGKKRVLELFFQKHCLGVPNSQQA